MKTLSFRGSSAASLQGMLRRWEWALETSAKPFEIFLSNFIYMFYFSVWSLFTLFLFIPNLLEAVLDLLQLKLLYAF